MSFVFLIGVILRDTNVGDLCAANKWSCGIKDQFSKVEGLSFFGTSNYLVT